MSYFVETFSAILEKKNDDYALSDGIKDATSSMIPGTGQLAGQCFSTFKYLTYKDSKGTKYENTKAFNKAYQDYLDKAAKGEKGLKAASARYKAQDEVMRKCKAANKKEEYNLNKILGL